MTTAVAVSFDDGLSEQFGWAKELYNRDIIGTFYINPSTIGQERILSLEQLREMHDDMHHIIANHLWAHEAPRYGATLKTAIKSLIRAANWLQDGGFVDGCDLVALPYGSYGGDWLSRDMLALLYRCNQIRDVTRTGLNDIDDSKFVSACEKNKFSYVNGRLILHYFHGYHKTLDVEFKSFLDSLTMHDIKMTSMREIADSKIKV